MESLVTHWLRTVSFRQKKTHPGGLQYNRILLEHLDSQLLIACPLLTAVSGWVVAHHFRRSGSLLLLYELGEGTRLVQEYGQSMLIIKNEMVGCDCLQCSACESTRHKSLELMNLDLSSCYLVVFRSCTSWRTCKGFWLYQPTELLEMYMPVFIDWHLSLSEYSFLC